MTTQLAAVMQRVEREPVTRNSQEIAGHVSELYDLIARRAFEIFESRGATPGREREDWIRAESELLHPVLVNLAETPGGFVVQAEVPGFSGKDIEISVGPRRLLIFGARETRFHEDNLRMICSEAVANRVLRSLDLPSDVDATKASTALEDGVLTIDLPKLQNAA